MLPWYNKYLQVEDMSKIEEKIDEAAQEYAESLWKAGMYDKETPATEEDMAYAFKAGAKFALSHQ